MIRHISKEVKFAPLYVYRVPLLVPRRFAEAEKSNFRFSNPSEMTEIADKLRYFRYRKSLLKKEVAEFIGVDRTTYARYEERGRGYYELSHMEKLAKLYGVPIIELLDEFNLFLYRDQGKQIQAKREKLGMTQSEYASFLGVQLVKLRRWEQNKAQIFKSTWEKYFK